MLLKFKKTLDRYNYEDNDFRLINERSLELLKCFFSWISRYDFLQICRRAKEKGNFFSSFQSLSTCLIFSRLTDPISDKWYSLERCGTYFQEKKIQITELQTHSNSRITNTTECFEFSATDWKMTRFPPHSEWVSTTKIFCFRSRSLRMKILNPTLYKFQWPVVAI